MASFHRRLHTLIDEDERWYLVVMNYCTFYRPMVLCRLLMVLCIDYLSKFLALLCLFLLDLLKKNWLFFLLLAYLTSKILGLITFFFIFSSLKTIHATSTLFPSPLFLWPFKQIAILLLHISSFLSLQKTHAKIWLSCPSLSPTLSVITQAYFPPSIQLIINSNSPQ